MCLAMVGGLLRPEEVPRRGAPERCPGEVYSRGIIEQGCSLSESGR